MTVQFKVVVKTLLTSLLLTFLPVISGTTSQVAQAAYGVGLTNCENTNNLRITASHGKAFYIDSGINPKIDAGYVGYQIYNNSGSTKTGLWLKLSDFVGGKVSLSNLDDQYMQIDDIANNDTKTVYVLLKASGATTTEQSHLVEVFNKRPDLTGASKQTSCRYAFSAVKETIKASANKLENNTGSSITTGVGVSNSAVTLGETITVTVEGDPGQIGKGAAPDYDTIWLTPAGISSWPTRALKLIKVDIKFDRNDSGWATDPQYVDKLIIPNGNGLAEVDQGHYVARYTFKVIGNPGSSVRVAPVAQIASGTQMKHTDLAAFGSTTISFSSFTIPQTLQKGITSNSNLETGTAATISGATAGVTYVAIPYVETITSTSSSTFIVDEIVDKPSTSAIFYTGSATITDATRTNVTISDPTYISSEASLSPRPIHFIGPFQGSSARTVILKYKMWLPANGSTYTNTAFAQIGDQTIGASASAISKVNATTGNGTGSITVVTTTESLLPEVLTNPATNVDTTVATMNANVDPNANAGTIKFQYGTSSSLASYTQVTATTPASGAVSVSNTDPIASSYDLTGLSTGTTYYYRVVVDSSTTRLATGDIVSFTTSVPVAPPTLTTNTADSLTVTAPSTVKVRFNGTINPNNTTLNYLYFEYSTTSGFTSSTNIEINDGEATPTALTAGGPSPMSFSMYVTSGLAINTTYYYRIVGCTAQANSGVGCSTSGVNQTYTATAVSFSTNAANQNQTITFASIENKTYGSTGDTSTASSTSKLTVSVTSLTTTICTISNSVGGADTTTTTTVTIVKVGDCILEATQAGGTIGGVTYNAATPVQVSFNISPATITVTAADKTRTTTQSVGSFTATLNVGAAKYSDVITFSTAVYLFSGKGSTSYATSSTQPDSATVGTYSITPSSPELVFTPASAAVNYQVTTVDGTYTINEATSYTVTFNSNYGTPTTTTQSSNTAANLTANTFSRTGYIFVGWADTSTSTTVAYANQASYPFTSSTTLYAIWNVKATSYTFTGPDTGTVNSASTSFTLTPNAYVESTTVVTITYGGSAQGSLTTTTVTFTAGTNTAQTFSVTPTVIGDLTLTPTNNQGLTNPAALTYVSYGTYTFTGPGSGEVSTASTNFTLTPNAVVGNSTTVTITYAGTSKGSLTTSTVTFSAGSSAAQTFTVTPTVVGTLTLTPTTNNTRLTNPSALNYVVNAAGTFTVTFDSNYGTPTTTTQSGSTTTNLTANSFSRTGYSFGGWGTVTDTTTVAYANQAPYPFTSAITLYAIWTINTHTITLTPTTSNGSVGSSPAGITGCSTANVACVGTYNYSTSVTLTATPSANYKVNAWTGACSGSALTCSLSMTENKVVGISYVATYTVTLGTLTNSGTGTILIDTSPATAAATITLTIQAEAGKQLKSGTLKALDASNAEQTLTGSGPYTFTMPASNVTITAEFEAVAAGTYTITINSATGGSGSSSVATVSSGGSVTLTATASSGYTFSSWSCTGGGTLSSSTANPATLSNITANATCTPVFTQNTTNSGGGGGGAAAPVGRGANKIVVARLTNTQPNSMPSGNRPVFTGTSSTLTPGNSANKTSTVLPTATTATNKTGGVIAVVTNPGGQSAPLNSNQSAASQGVAAVSAVNTTAQTALERRSEIPSSVNIERDANNGIQVSANNGWTGRVAVAVVNGNSDEDVETFVEVVIAPTPAVAPKIVQEEPPAIQKPEEKPKPGLVITWAPSQSEVVGYVVTVNSQPTCFSMSTSCEITQLIGPKTKVAVIAEGNDNTFSTPVPLPAFKPTKPIPALVVNFAVASSVLSPKFKADLRDLAKVMVKEGFTKVDISGHTDSTGQAVSYDNQKLSDARAKATLTYLKRFVPKLQSVTGAYAYERRITDESTPEALYTNRRAEVAVS